MKKKIKNIQMVIVCGGRGKRMGSITNKYPKPMIKIGKKKKRLQSIIKRS